MPIDNFDEKLIKVRSVLNQNNVPDLALQFVNLADSFTRPHWHCSGIKDQGIPSISFRGWPQRYSGHKYDRKFPNYISTVWCEFGTEIKRDNQAYFFGISQSSEETSLIVFVEQQLVLEISLETEVAIIDRLESIFSTLNRAEYINPMRSFYTTSSFDIKVAKLDTWVTELHELKTQVDLAATHVIETEAAKAKTREAEKQADQQSKIDLGPFQ